MLRVWHERASEPALKKIERKVTVGADGAALAETPISEAGYLALPHMNKYGTDYTPEPPARVPYSAGGGR